MGEEAVVEIKITAASRKEIARLKTQLEFNQLQSLLFQRLEVLALKTASYVIKTTLSGNRLKRRTGGLARSVIGKAERMRGLPVIRVGVLRGPSLAYAGILERGGTIEPKNAKALAIPQEKAMTPAGVDRYGGPRNYPGELRFIPFRGGRVAVGRLVDAGEYEAAMEQGLELRDVATLYLLVKRVQIPAYHWLSDPVKEFLPQIAADIASFVKELIRGDNTKSRVNPR
jgi:hypothetical protein